MQERGDVGSYVRVSFSIKILRHSRGATSYFFREGYTSWNEDTLIKVLPARHERKSLQGKISLFFHLDTSISNEKFNSQMNTIRSFLFLFFGFFFKARTLFYNFLQKVGETFPPPPDSYAPAWVFSCEFCKTFKNTFFIEELRWLLLEYV